MGIKELQQTISSHKLLCVDTNIIIYLLENHLQYANLSATLMKAIETGEVHGATSMMTLAEVLTQPARLGKRQVMQDYEIYLTNFPNFTLYPVDIDIARQAARIRAVHTVQMPDAIQLATARIAGADAIVTNDKDWRGKTGSATLLILDEYL